MRGGVRLAVSAAVLAAAVLVPVGGAHAQAVRQSGGSELQSPVMLGDVGGLQSVVFARVSLVDGAGAAAGVGDWREWCFSLGEARKVGVGLRQLDRDADLVLRTAGGDTLVSSRAAGTANEWVEASLRGGDYCVRVTAAQAGSNDFVLRYGVDRADEDDLLPAAPAPQPAAQKQSAAKKQSAAQQGSKSDAQHDGAEQGSGAGVVLSGLMVVGEGEAGGDEGFGFSSWTSVGSLAPVRFGERNEVHYLAHFPATGLLHLGLSSRPEGEASLVLEAGDVSVLLGDASLRRTGSWDYSWPLADVGWTVGDTVTVRLFLGVLPNRPPVGSPSITGINGFPTTFQASVAGIADDDGLTEAEFEYQWIGVRNGAETVVGGATDASYVARLTKGFDGYRVRVSYVDDRGAPESLTSTTADVRSHVAQYGQMLPDLTSTAPRLVRFSRAEVGSAIVMPADGSQELQWNDRPMLLLRFDSEIANIGAGPLVVEGNPQLADPADDTSHKVWQRTRTSGGAWVKLTRPPIRFEEADGHYHFHLMRIAEYSLWDEAGEVRLQTSPKAGFCLADVSRITDWEGAEIPWTYLPLCGSGPDATKLQMGISSGWKDIYGSYAAFQWVDVSDVTPGRYRLGSQVDPDDVVWESDETNNGVALGETVWAVPGYVAANIASRTDQGVAVAVTLRADSFGSPGALRFRIVEGPRNGTLDADAATTLTHGTLNYTPDAGFSGQDTFVYEAFDKSSEFPHTPVRATATIQVVDLPFSENARLRSLSVSDGDIGAFDGGVFDYSVDVPVHTKMTTITASSVASGGASAVAFDVVDADSVAEGHQVSLGSSDPVTVTITVTAPNGINTYTYTVTISAAPAWRATMTVGEANNANGYNASAGGLTSASFDVGGVTYTLTEILAWEFMFITVDSALPEGFVFEVDGEQFALSDADADAYSYGTVYYWEDADQIWPQGSTVSLALYPAG